MKGAGCWIRVKEVHPVSDLLLNLCERLCRYPCAWRLHAQSRLSCAQGGNLEIRPSWGRGEGGGIFCWNNLSKLVLSVHTKFHLSVPTGTG